MSFCLFCRGDHDKRASCWNKADQMLYAAGIVPKHRNVSQGKLHKLSREALRGIAKFLIVVAFIFFAVASVRWFLNR